MIPFARRLRAADGHSTGIIVADIDPRYFFRLFHDLNLGAHAVVTLSEVDGDPLLASTTAEAANANVTSVLVSSNQPSELGHLQRRAMDQIATSSRSEGYPLVVTVEIDRGDVEHQWMRPVGAALAGLLVFSGVVLAFARTVERHRQERAEALQRSIVAQKLEAMGQMTASVAHDFRNILAVFSSALRLIRKRGPQPDVLAETEKTIERGNAMVERLLAFSRRKDPELETIDLNTLVSGLEPTLRDLAGAQALAIKFASDLPFCRIDRVQFDAALMNLVVNARQATPSDGRITIETATGAGEVVVTVEDSGCGIDEATLQRVFEPFFTTKAGTGTGLGLAQVHNCVEQAGGRVTVASRVGQGTAFSLHFPIALSNAGPIGVRRLGNAQ